MPASSRSRSERWLGVKTFADASRKVRANVLAPSGGWMFDVCTQVSNATGLWDVIVLSGIFVFGWATLRLSPKQVSLVLGNVFDVTIPLQHQLSENKRVQEIHKSHLAGYWPVLYCGMAVELAGYFLVHPDLFTLVVCVKTTLLTVIWLGRAEGKFWTSQWYKGRVGATTSASSAPSTSGDKKKQWEEQLRKKGYTSDEGIKEMVDALAKLPEKDQERSLRHMLRASDKEVKDRNDKWSRRSSGSSNDAQTSSGSGGKGRGSAAPPAAGSNGNERSSRSEQRKPASDRGSSRSRGSEKGQSTSETPKPATTSASPGAPPASSSLNRPIESKPGASRWPRRDRPRDAWRGNLAPN